MSHPVIEYQRLQTEARLISITGTNKGDTTFTFSDGHTITLEGDFVERMPPEALELTSAESRKVEWGKAKRKRLNATMARGPARRLIT